MMSDFGVHSFEGFSEAPLCDLPQIEVVLEEAQNARSTTQELETELVRQGNSDTSTSPTSSCLSRFSDIEDMIYRILKKVLRRDRDRRHRNPSFTPWMIVGCLALTVPDAGFLVVLTMTTLRLTPTHAPIPRTIGSTLDPVTAAAGGLLFFVRFLAILQPTTPLPHPHQFRLQR